ncbi:unnamed protein product [Arabidopsis thaliana]|uniref:(thale cress) hypothetical protein n=1 Tax=Arabidopsis thaliana TaxID=3702 RepID=A0A7G2FEQ5_ARATH|nr:unnamed protein product [Arabidopsis thaliana]
MVKKSTTQTSTSGFTTENIVANRNPDLEMLKIYSGWRCLEELQFLRFSNWLIEEAKKVKRIANPYLKIWRPQWRDWFRFSKKLTQCKKDPTVN